ncbi:hypothetical protein, partial [Glutamicibacter ardleyensis]|uniref:hypothetical protein n=1 Tax=Glutamicibacter ardleyensis TaxID=225894 RepID=UPI003FD54BE4
TCSVMILSPRLRRLKRISVHGCLITRSDWPATVFEKLEPYQVEKAIVISVEAFAYAVLGVGLGSVLSTLGVESNGTSSQSVGLGLLSFVIVFILASIIYVVALPKGRFEELQARQQPTD